MAAAAKDKSDQVGVAGRVAQLEAEPSDTDSRAFAGLELRDLREVISADSTVSGRATAQERARVSSFLEDPEFAAIEAGACEGCSGKRIVARMTQFRDHASEMLLRFEKISRSYAEVVGKNVAEEGYPHIQRVLAVALRENLRSQPSIPVAIDETIFRSLPPELAEVERQDQRVQQQTAMAHEMAFEYLSSIVDHQPLTLKRIAQIHDSMLQHRASGEFDFVADFADELERVHTTLGKVVGLTAGDRLAVRDFIVLKHDIQLLTQCAGLTHLEEERGLNTRLSESAIGRQLIEEGLIGPDQLTLIDSVTTLALNNVDIPGKLIKSQKGWKVLAEFAESVVENEGENADNLTFTLQHYERLLLDEPETRAAFEGVLSGEEGYCATGSFRQQLLKFYHTLQDNGLMTDTPEEIALLAVHLQRAGVNLRDAGNLVAEPPMLDFQDGKTVLTTPDQALEFLQRLGELYAHGAGGVSRLFDNAMEGQRLIHGYYAEARAATLLIDRGFQVKELSFRGRKSGYCEYDILVSDGQYDVGIEVKTSLEALFEKNYYAATQDSQLYRLTDAARKDGYRAAVMVLNDRGHTVLASLQKVWEDVTTELGIDPEQGPLLLNKDTGRIAWDGSISTVQ